MPARASSRSRARRPVRAKEVDAAHRRREARSALVVIVAAVAAVGTLAIARSDGDGEDAAADPAMRSTARLDTGRGGGAGESTRAAARPRRDGRRANAAAAEPPLSPDCRIEADTLRPGDTGTDVKCLQQALIEEGYLEGELTGEYDDATFAAVERLQADRDLFVDGVAGRETALSVDVWRDEQEFVVRTPPPPEGAVDEMGFALSSVSSIGDDVPPLPANSGNGRRVVYERAGQRVWAVAEDGHVIRSWLVSGSKYDNEWPGTYQVYSRSEQSTAWNGRAILPLMIRWRETEIGHIGFHGIPRHVEDGSPYQTEAELGSRLSGGCQRQADPDAAFLWAFADIGTTVVVL